MNKTIISSFKNKSPVCYRIFLLAALLGIYGLAQVSVPQIINAQSDAAGRPGQDGEYICGTYSGDSAGRNVKTKFDFGCLGTAYADNPSGFPDGSKNLTPILDFTYAIIRFLSIGVGIAITLALIASGIQYSASEGNAEASTKAKKRVESAITGLLIYIFSYALLQFLIPGGVFK